MSLLLLEGVFGEAEEEEGGPALPSGLRRRLALLALGVVGLPMGDALLLVMTMAETRACVLWMNVH